MREREKSVWLALPNIISLVRIFLIPVFVLMMIWRKTSEAFAILLLAGFTDVLDGFMARALKQRTKLGTLLDPAADKLLITASFILLTIPRLNSPNVIPLWLTMIVIGRDLLIVSGAFLLFKLRGQKTFPPSIPGKASTVCQIIVVLLVLLFNLAKATPPFLVWLYFLTLALVILSTLHYSKFGLRIMFRSGQAPAK
jgi:cardiolipin synthase